MIRKCSAPKAHTKSFSYYFFLALLACTFPTGTMEASYSSARVTYITTWLLQHLMIKYILTRKSYHCTLRSMKNLAQSCDSLLSYWEGIYKVGKFNAQDKKTKYKSPLHMFYLVIFQSGIYQVILFTHFSEEQEKHLIVCIPDENIRF